MAIPGQQFALVLLSFFFPGCSRFAVRKGIFIFCFWLCFLFLALVFRPHEVGCGCVNRNIQYVLLVAIDGFYLLANNICSEFAVLVIHFVCKFMLFIPFYIFFHKNRRIGRPNSNIDLNEVYLEEIEEKNNRYLVWMLQWHSVEYGFCGRWIWTISECRLPQQFYEDYDFVRKGERFVRKYTHAVL